MATNEDEKLIRITCEAAAVVPLEEFEEFQGELKWLEEKQYEKLKASMLKDGFHTSIDVWKKKGEKKPRKMLDGHQRVRALRMMIDKEGYTIDGEGLPVDWVIAPTERAAKRLILEKLSQYGKYNENTVYEFAKLAELDWFEDIKPFADFPTMNMGTFEVGWWADKEMKIPDGGENPIAGEAVEGKQVITITVPTENWPHMKDKLMELANEHSATVDVS